jgi:hypothetical protein
VRIFPANGSGVFRDPVGHFLLIAMLAACFLLLRDFDRAFISRFRPFTGHR